MSDITNNTETSTRSDSSVFNAGTRNKQMIHEELSAAMNRNLVEKLYLEGKARDIADEKKSSGPCIVIGSGGTLDDALPRLKDWKGGIICTSSHAVSLVYHGIEPTHIVALDPFCDEVELSGVDWSKTRTKLVMTPTVWPTILSSWPNEVLLYLQFNGQNDSFYSGVLKRQYTIREQIPGGARLRDAIFKHMIRTEITLFACSPPIQMFIAHLLGYKDTFLVGCDFGYTNNVERFGETTKEFGEWVHHKHPIERRLKEVTEKNQQSQMVTSSNGILSDIIHLYYKKNMLTALRLSMQSVCVVGRGTITELPTTTIDKLMKSQGIGHKRLPRKEQIDIIENYLASVGAFVIESNGGYTFVEANDPVPQLTSFMGAMNRKYKCPCGVNLDANDEINHTGETCPSCKEGKLIKSVNIDIKENIKRIKSRLKKS